MRRLAETRAPGVFLPPPPHDFVGSLAIDEANRVAFRRNRLFPSDHGRSGLTGEGAECRKSCEPVQSLLAGRQASRLRGRGLDFEELRQYQFGDDVRRIDWKATNRTGKTQLRVYTEERERAVLLIVDQRLKMFFGSRRNMKSVTAAQAAAIAAWRVTGKTPDLLCLKESFSERLHT